MTKSGVSAAEAVSIIKSRDRVFIHSVADLYGKNIEQRAKALIQIAHPDHREELEKGYREICH